MEGGARHASSGGGRGGGGARGVRGDGKRTGRQLVVNSLGGLTHSGLNGGDEDSGVELWASQLSWAATVLSARGLAQALPDPARRPNESVLEAWHGLKKTWARPQSARHAMGSGPLVHPSVT